MGDLEQLKYLLLATALSFSVPLHAQPLPGNERQKSPVYFGISGGIASNVLVGSEIDLQKKVYNNSMSPVKGPMFSVFLKNEILPRLYLKWEATYIRKGNNSLNNALWNLNVEYVSIPVKIGFQPINFANVSSDFQLGFEMGASFNLEQGKGTDNLAKAYAAAYNSKVNRWAISALAGANMEYRIFPHRILFLNCTWYHDLSPLLSYQNGNANYKANNQGWMFTGGVMFRLH